jgi:HPt (histidine-containing phosphotransfer) domain-containing protein
MMQPWDSVTSKTIVVSVDANIEDLIPVFLEARRGDVKALVEALEKGDYDTVLVLGHNMKGSGGSYGFDFITELGRDLEQSAKEQNAEKVGRLVKELSTYLERVEVVYV